METGKDMPAFWPGWKTVRLIGRGSFGAVYEIERDVFGHKEKAALKHISIPQSDSDIEELYDSGYDEQSVTATFKSHLQSIVNEYSLMREMNGAANVVNCDDFRIVPHDDNIGWDIFIKMELLTPLTKALGRQPDEAQVIRIAKDMCGALILCRKYGIIHRDIKPQNIFVSKNGDYKLGDFGIAKTIEKTSGGTKIGTYKYMAPEVYNNRPYGAAADIYSLGLVLHWMLNERRSPFMPLPPAPAVAAQEEEARARRFSGEPLPPPAHGGEALKRIVLKACAFDPQDRWQSAEDMLRALDSLSASSAPAKSVDDEATVLERRRTIPDPELDEVSTVVEDKTPAPHPPASAETGVSDGPAVDDDGDGTIGVFSRKIDKTPAPASAGADAPDDPSSDGEGTTIGVFNPAAPIPPASAEAGAPDGPSPDDDATVPVATYTPRAQKAAPAEPPKKKFPIWIPIVGVLAVAAILLLVLLPKGGAQSSSQASHKNKREQTEQSVNSSSANDFSDASEQLPETGVFALTGSDPADEIPDAIPDEMTSADGRYPIAFVLDAGPLKDNGYNQNTYDGVKRCAVNAGLSYKYYQPANGDWPSDDDRYNAMKAAVDGGASVVVCNGFMQYSALERAAKDFPDVKFVFLDGWSFGLPNVIGISFREEQCGFLAGYAAVMEGYTRLGFCGGGGGTNPVVNRYGYGFVQGAEAAAAARGVNVEMNYTFLYGDSYIGSPELQALVSGWYENGTEVVFPCGGDIFSSVVAAASANGGKVIGVDVDQSFQSDTVITSALKEFGAAAGFAIDAAMNGRWDALTGGSGFATFGAAEGAVGLPVATWSLRNWSVGEYESVLNDIAIGRLAVDMDFDNLASTAHVSLNVVE